MHIILFAILVLIAVLFLILGIVYEIYPLCFVSGVLFLIVAVDLYVNDLVIKTGEVLSSLYFLMRHEK